MTRTLPALAVFLLVTGCGLMALLVPLPLAARILLVFAGGFVATGAVMTLSAHGQTPDRTPVSTPPQPTETPEISAKLRHDLRGMLSPAVLAADQLTLSSDETTHTRANQILAALDRATDRLKTAKS